MLNYVSRILSAVLLAGAVFSAPGQGGRPAADHLVGDGAHRRAVDVPPFGSVDAKNQPVGLDVDMAKNIAKALGVKLELQQITGANRVPYLVTDRLDIVIAAMGATPERALQIAFTSPYAALSIGVFGPDSIAVTSLRTEGPDASPSRAARRRTSNSPRRRPRPRSSASTTTRLPPRRSRRVRPSSSPRRTSSPRSS